MGPSQVEWKEMGEQTGKPLKAEVSSHGGTKLAEHSVKGA